MKTNTVTFPITYQTVSGESATHGDFVSNGYLPRSGNIPRGNHLPKRPARFTLRQARDLLQPGGSSPVEADSAPCEHPRWLTCQITPDWERPAVSLSLHLDGCSPATARRIARWFGVRLG